MSSSSSSSTANNDETLSLFEAMDYAAATEPCNICFWLYWFVLLFLFLIIIILYVFRRRDDWGLNEWRRNLEELQRHQSDVSLQENLSNALADYWAKDTAQEWRLADEVAEEINSEENAQTKSLEDFNFALEARRKAHVKALRRNAFKKRLPSEASDWSVTLDDMMRGDQLDAETLLAQFVLILPKPFLPVSTSKAYLKEEVRVALFTMLRKINFEGYDRHVAALVASAVVVWNDGEEVKLGGQPFYPPFPLLPFADVEKAIQKPENEEEEMIRLRELSPEVPFKMTYYEVMDLERSIEKEAAQRRNRLDKMKQKKWTRMLAQRLVNSLTKPRVFEALEALKRKNQNNSSEVAEVSVRPSNTMEQELAQIEQTNEVAL